jgi:hypothetical protein
MAAELLLRTFNKEITEELRKDNSFMQFAKNDDAFVNSNSVELPHAGADPTILVDNTSYPLTITQRTDTATQYLLEKLSSNPTHLEFSEEMIVSYNKRASIFDAHVKGLKQKMADRMAFKWAENNATAGTGLVATTATATRNSSAAGSTATVKRIDKTDLLTVRAIFDGDDIPQAGRKLLVNSLMYQDILLIDDFTHADKLGLSVIPDGFIGRIFGFDIFQRSSVNRYATGGATIKDTEAANVATDLGAGMAWHPDFVRRAMGSVKTFLDIDNAEYQGTIFSAQVRTGGLNARNDSPSPKGVVSLVEAV